MIETTEQLLAQYRANAVRHGRASELGQSRQCNRAHDELRRIRRELDRRGPEDTQRLLELIEDDDRSVRCWVGSEALSFSPDDGVRVLREIAAGPPGMVRLNAQTTLEIWHSGEWQPLS